MVNGEEYSAVGSLVARFKWIAPFVPISGVLVANII
jgi:hypothetical protein